MLGENDPLLSAMLGPVGGASFPTGTPAAPAAPAGPRSTFNTNGMSPDALTALAGLEALSGQSFGINSAYRSPEHNARVGGARHSQHTQGNAFDIEVSAMSQADREYLITLGRQAGFGGVGVYDNALHFDVGPQRNWGPDYSAGSTPEWALDELMAPASSGGSASSASAPSNAHAGHDHGAPTGGGAADPATGGLLERLFAPPQNEARAEAAIDMAANGIELSQQSGSPLLALLAPMAGALATRRATRTGGADEGAAGNAMLEGLDLDERGQAALGILRNPSAPEWQRSLAEDILGQSLEPPSASSQRLTGQIEGPGGVLYGQNSAGELEAYTAPDGQPIRAQDGGGGGITYVPATAEEAAANNAPQGGQMGSNGRFYPNPRPPAPSSTADPITWEPMTPEEALSHGWASGQKSSRGQVQQTGRDLSDREIQEAEEAAAAAAAAASRPTPQPDPRLPSEPALSLSPEDEAFIKQWAP